MDEHKSEIARVLQQIKTEYEAAVSGMSGLAQGSSRHSFINARVENMGKLQEQLDHLVGDNAIALVIQALEPCPEPPTVSLP